MSNPRPAVIAGLALVAAVAAYAAGLATGLVTAFAYASGTERQEGFSSTRWLPINLGTSTVWLSAGSAVRADFDVDARFGALSLTVAPPLIWRLPQQAATAFVAGRRSGSVLFVAQTAGWYTVRADTTPVGGPRCLRERSMGEMMLGSSDCPTYDVSYSVVWRLADARGAARGIARLAVPRPREGLVTTHIRD